MHVYVHKSRMHMYNLHKHINKVSVKSVLTGKGHYVRPKPQHNGKHENLDHLN